MILTTHMSVNPVLENDPIIKLSPSSRHLSPIDANMIDVEMNFRARTVTENIVVHFIAVCDVVISFNVNGEPISL